MDKKNYETIRKLLDELIEKNLDAPIIVEGKKDVISLRKLGIKGEIMSLNIGDSIVDFCGKISNYCELILMLDWDRKGNEICKKIQDQLKFNKLKCNLSFRKKFAMLLSKETKEVEGIAKLYQKT